MVLLHVLGASASVLPCESNGPIAPARAPRPNRARALTATASWFEHHRAVGAFGGVCQCFRGFCERIGGADVDAEPAVGE